MDITDLTEKLAFEIYASQTQAEGLTPRAWEFVCNNQFMEAHIARAAAVHVVQMLGVGGIACLQERMRDKNVLYDGPTQ